MLAKPNDNKIRLHENSTIVIFSTDVIEIMTVHN